MRRNEMSVKVIIGYNDPDYPIYQNYISAFNPDDWDYIIVGDNKNEVENIAEKLYVCDYQIKQFIDRWIAVTYHS